MKTGKSKEEEKKKENVTISITRNYKSNSETVTSLLIKALLYGNSMFYGEDEGHPDIQVPTHRCLLPAKTTVSSTEMIEMSQLVTV